MLAQSRLWLYRPVVPLPSVTNIQRVSILDTVFYIYSVIKTQPQSHGMNKLYYGDNLEVLRKYVKDESVDLCYIDPPFNSKRNYNQIYNNIGGG